MMKRVLCLIDSLVAGGAQRQLVGLAAHLQERGYVVKVVTYYDIPFYLSYLRDNKVDYEYLSCGRGVFQRLSAINKAIKAFSPNIVISYLNTPNILACLLRTHRSKWTLLVSERNTTQSLGLRERIKFYLYRNADVVIPNSYSQRDFICSHYPKLKKKCRVITNFVETDVFTPAEKKETNRITRIIGVGRIANQKNILILIEALRILRDKGERVRVDWYGNPFESFEKCVASIHNYGLQPYFEFHLPYNPIVEKYHQSDIFVLPSIYEGFPNVLCEAMACGLPSIASDVCDNGRIINDGKNGFLFSSGDANSLANCIQKVIHLTDEQRSRINKNSRLTAVELFSENVFINRYITLIEQ